MSPGSSSIATSSATTSSVTGVETPVGSAPFVVGEVLGAVPEGGKGSVEVDPDVDPDVDVSPLAAGISVALVAGGVRDVVAELGVVAEVSVVAVVAVVAFGSVVAFGAVGAVVAGRPVVVVDGPLGRVVETVGGGVPVVGGEVVAVGGEVELGTVGAVVVGSGGPDGAMGGRHATAEATDTPVGSTPLTLKVTGASEPTASVTVCSTMTC